MLLIVYCTIDKALVIVLLYMILKQGLGCGVGRLGVGGGAYCEESVLVIAHPIRGLAHPYMMIIYTFLQDPHFKTIPGCCTGIFYASGCSS